MLDEDLFTIISLFVPEIYAFPNLHFTMLIKNETKVSLLTLTNSIYFFFLTASAMFDKAENGTIKTVIDATENATFFAVCGFQVLLLAFVAISAH